MPLRFLTAGESHGPELTAILEGMPAGLPVDLDALRADMARRQKAYGAGGRMKIEQDAALDPIFNVDGEPVLTGIALQQIVHPTQSLDDLFHIVATRHRHVDVNQTLLRAAERLPENSLWRIAFRMQQSAGTLERLTGSLGSATAWS